jgi:superfamily II RNA helicase
MVKINPIHNSTLNKLVHSTGKVMASTQSATTTPMERIAPAIGIGASASVISTFIKDYKSTAEDKNYFQLKIDPNTGKHYEPDIFQNAAGMNLYLGNDVLVTAPTGTGKTAIAEYVITKNLNEGKCTFYTTPLKALSNEKFHDFSNIYGKENVGLITGDTKINKDAPIIIMTTEVYRNMAANNSLNFDKNKQDNGLRKDLQTVIFDELQYLGDVDRGGVWEQSIMFTPKNVQILSLSATIGNNEEINDWIASTKEERSQSITPNAKYIPQQEPLKKSVLINVPSENRHVPLNFEIEHVAPEIKPSKIGSKAQRIKSKQDAARKSQSVQAQPKKEAYKDLTKKLNNEKKLPAIYFVFNKKDSRHLLKYLSTESELLTTDEEQKQIKEIIERYKREGYYLGESLNTNALLKGYAIHNSGLLPSQKQLIEELFQKKLVKVVIATETLSAGINMPAKTTVITAPRKPASTSDEINDGKRVLSPNEFHQMAGRSGRRGIDTVGYCYPISCNSEQEKIYTTLMNSPSNPLNSSLNLDFSFIANYLSEFKNEDELKYILSKSLFAYKNKDKIQEILKNFRIKTELLKNENFIEQNGKLTDKGLLLKLINGYEQIPVINFIFDKSIDNLNPVQLAGLIGGLANIDYEAKGTFPEKSFEITKIQDTDFATVANSLVEQLKKYDMKMKEINENKEIKITPSSMEHLYEWAYLNQNKSNSSKKNWQQLYAGEQRFSIKDEGSLFKEITLTADLLKQMINIAHEGAKLTKDSYYLQLANKLQEALELIQQEPISS